jgi:hypothetical protein
MLMNAKLLVPSQGCLNAIFPAPPFKFLKTGLIGVCIKDLKSFERNIG